jgi:hypothetical protein
MGDALSRAGDDDRQRVWVSLVRLFTSLIPCPYCGASSCRPCRTFSGRIPGRISDPHRDRLRLAEEWIRTRTPPPMPAEPQQSAALSPSGPYPRVGFWPYDDAGEHLAWLHCWVAGWVGCPACGAAPAQPCRTSAGSAPGRTTTLHKPRLALISDMGITVETEPGVIWNLVRAARQAAIDAHARRADT